MKKSILILCVTIAILALVVIPVTSDALDVKVTIRHFRQIENPDPNTGTDGDYYAKVKIGGGPWQTTDNFDDTADITPNWEFKQEVVGERNIPVTIQMWDSDPIGNPDDIIDLNPVDNVQELNVIIDVLTGQWSNPSYQRGVQGDGDTEHYGILEGGEAGWILFDVTTCYNEKCDIDDDGIPDGVEIQGIRDLDGNLVWNVGEGTAYELDPCRKTIAVEVDYMSGATDGHTHQPMGAALVEAKEMFENAPVPALSVTECPYANFPRKPSGINFIVHEDLSDNIPEQQVFTCDDFNDAFKNAHFAHRDVLGQYFHYNLWVHDHITGVKHTSSGQACGGGRGDYLVSLGSWANQNGVQRDQAGTFAHELGHTLALGHGGSDGINYKPNYLSIMNYEWQTVGLTDSATGISRLDFSHSALPTLDEQSLSEPNGISDGTIITDWRDPNRLRHIDVGNGPLDWTWDDRNGNGIADDDTGVNVDLNGDNICIGGGSNNAIESTPTPDDILDPNCGCTPAPCPCIRNGPNGQCESKVIGNDYPVYIYPGYDDWSHINYGGGSGSGGGVSVDLHDEITFEQAQIIKAFWVQVLAPDLAIEKKVDYSDALPGDTLTYTVKVTNVGKVPVTAIQLTDTFPDGTIETRSLPDLALEASKTEKFTYKVPFPITDGKVIINSAKVTGTDINGNPEEDTSNNIATASTTVHTPVLTFAKTATASVNAGEAITYTLTYQNTGSADAEGVIITDTLPKDVYYSIALDLGSGPKPGSVVTNSDGTTTLTWTIGALTTGSGMKTITYTGRPSLLFLAGSSVTNKAVLDFTDKNVNDYPALTATATTTITTVTPGRSPKTLGYYRTHPEVWTAETLARIQATDTRFDGADGSTPNGKLSSTEMTEVFAPAGNQPKVLLMQLLATDFNLATRQINAGTSIKSKTATRMGLTTVRSADVYAMETLKLPVTTKNMGRYSDATTVLDEINNGKSEVY